jgi:NitT/TauT family transport system permease protein
MLRSQPLPVEPAATRALARPRYRLRWRLVALYAALAVATLLIWQIIARTTIPILFPPPIDVFNALASALADGTLIQDIGISYFRIITGWLIGCALAVPLGMLTGRSSFLRTITEPYIEFFRYIPPIAFITLFLIWFGLGELSKILLIVYTAFFVTFIATLAGAMAVDQEKVRAAQCLGAKPAQVFWRVIVPATVPAAITGIRMALGNAFMTVIAAEFVAAQSGIGFLIFSSRLFAQTDYVFAGILTLGVMGFVANAVLRRILKAVAYRYSIQY